MIYQSFNMQTKGPFYVLSMESKDWIQLTDDLMKNVFCWAVLSKNLPQEYPRDDKVQN